MFNPIAYNKSGYYLSYILRAYCLKFSKEHKITDGNIADLVLVALTNDVPEGDIIGISITHYDGFIQQKCSMMLPQDILQQLYNKMWSYEYVTHYIKLLNNPITNPDFIIHAEFILCKSVSAAKYLLGITVCKHMRCFVFKTTKLFILIRKHCIFPIPIFNMIISACC